MGVDTHLYLNTRWGLDDIKKVIERTQRKKIEVRSNHDTSIGFYYFTIGNRTINVFTNHQTPIGTATYLSMSANEESHNIFGDIAEVLGGILEYYDSDGKCEMIDGSMSDEDGLAYFVKYAIVHDGVKSDDLQGFLDSKKEWHKRIES